MKFSEENFKCIPPPLTPVEVSGLYNLITEVDIDWMPKDLLNDSQGCMKFLHKMVEEGTLGVNLAAHLVSGICTAIRCVLSISFSARPSICSSCFSKHVPVILSKLLHVLVFILCTSHVIQ